MTKRPILCIRPEPGLSSTLAHGRDMGLNMVGAALFKIEPVDWELPADLSFDGLLLGSANAIRHGGGKLERLKHLPAYPVGGNTAKIAEEAGFSIGKVGQGGLQGLLDALAPTPSAHRPQIIRLLRLAGEEKVDLFPASGCVIEEKTVYRAVPLPASEILRDALLSGALSGAVTLLHSAKAAEYFSSECNRLMIDKSGLSIASLAPRISQAAGEGWLEKRVADSMNDRALLDLAANMCK